MIEVVVGALGSVALVVGLGLATIGLFGMFRHPTIFEQLHAAGLVTGPAAILVLLAALASGNAEILTSALLVVVFVLVTSSLSTHVVALAGWQQRESSGRPATADRRVGSAPGDASVASMRLLVAHDGSPGSGTAMALVRSLVWPAGSRVRLVGVTEGDLPALSDAAGGPPAAADDPARPSLALAAAARELERPGLAVEHRLRAGDPAMAIVGEAEDLDADLVVVGSRGLGRVRSILSGSVASGVLDHAPCPVLVARTSTVRTVLLATDGSDASAAATEALATWPIFEDVDIAVLGVEPLPDLDREAPSTQAVGDAAGGSGHRRSAEAAAARLQGAGRRADLHVEVGDAADRIVAFAEAHAVDLIVLGSRGRTGLTRALLGSVARDVSSATGASVLVVRSSR